MSADNGIYILQTKKGAGWEYRVRELSGIENLYWKFVPTKKNAYARHETNDRDVWIENARKMWAGCKVFKSKTKAFAEADQLAQDTYILEYGISTISIDREV